MRHLPDFTPVPQNRRVGKREKEKAGDHVATRPIYFVLPVGSDFVLQAVAPLSQKVRYAGAFWEPGAAVPRPIRYSILTIRYVRKGEPVWSPVTARLCIN